MSGGVRLQFSSPQLLSLCLWLLSAGRTRGDQHGVVKVFSAEGSDVILPCSLSTKENIQSELFDWRKVAQKNEGLKEVFLYDAGTHYNNGRSGQSEQFKGRVFHFPDQLEYGNASIIIRNAKMTDGGNYTCDFPRLQPPQIFHVEVVVEPIMKDRSGENSAATPEPYIRTLDATETRALLQCDVRGASLKPKVEWQDSAGNILPAEEPQVSERGGSYDIILRTTVTKTDRYRCVVTQETIGHQVSAETFVRISEKDSSSIIGSFFGGLLSGAVIIVAVQALLVVTKVITIRRNKGSRQQRSGSHNKRYSLVNQRNGPVDQRNGHVDQRNGPVDQRNGPVDQKNGPVDQRNGPVDQGNGHVDQGNGPVDQRNGHVDQGNGPVDQGNGPVDQGNGPVDQGNSPVEGPSERLLQPVDISVGNHQST